MKTIFIPAKVRANINKDKIKSLAKNLPENIAIAYSIQYKELAENIIKQLEKNKIKVDKLQKVLVFNKIKTKHFYTTSIQRLPEY